MAKYEGNGNFEHGGAQCVGVLLVNLGTPDAPDPRSVRRYLAEFLSDPRVAEMPRILWLPILHGIILNTRPHRSAHAYRQIWTAEGSPLLAITTRMAAALQGAFAERAAGAVRVVPAMRYGNPSVRAGLEVLRAAGARRVLVLPLYPQYSAPTSASTFDAVSGVLRRWRRVPALRTVMSYHDDPGYIAALARSIESHWQAHGRGERLLLSFHGLPERYSRAGDPYHCQCHETARLVTESLRMKDGEWTVTFQSRFGPRSWLKPYTDVTLTELAGGGVNSVDVVCPGFPADCLETLEEISLRNRDTFLAAGGKTFHYIPALNDRREHIAVLADLALRNLKGWLEES